MAKKLILSDRVVQGLLVIEEAALFRQQVGDGGHTRVRLGRGGIVVIDRAVGIQYALVIALACAVAGRAH